ncbi:MAG TPA: peptide ABC transporter substrate-binding protein [Chloroflexia bacterium]|nr:peptide ABC transporter substrate-binding protein [Chloroflexia bacterium]
MPSKRALHLLILGLLVATLLAACGDNTATNAPAATTAAATTSAAATSAAATSAAATTSAAAGATTAASTTTAATGSNGSLDLTETVKFDGTSGKKGGQLVFAYAGQFPASMQPYYTSDNVALTNINMVYGYLVGQSNNSKFYPYLLSEIPTLDNGGVKVGTDGKTMDLTLKLKPGLKWSDGSPLTSKDLVYTWKWVTDPDNSGVAIDLTPWTFISGIDTPDDSTAVMHFKQIFGPYLNFLNTFWPLPEKVWGKIPLKDGGAEKTPEATQPTVTSGPFKVDEFVADDRITMSRNDNFQPVWGFNAYLDKVIFRNTSDANAAIAGVSKGDLDEAENLDDNLLDAASKVPNAKFDIAQQYSWEYLQFNLSNPLFQDKNVRKALEMGIDKKALIKQFRTPKTTELGVNFSPLSAFADTSLKPAKFDPEAAKKLLDDAGWKPGSDGIRAKDGKKLTFTLSSTTAPVRRATAEVIASYWKALGVEVKFQGYSSTQYFGPWNSDGILARGRYDVGMFAQVGGIDNDGSFNNYYSGAIPTDANKGNGNNYGRINDPAIDKALQDERNTVDQTKRKDAWTSFQKALYDNTYEISLYTRVNNYLYNNKVKNFKPNPTTDGNYWNVVELYVQ